MSAVTLETLKADLEGKYNSLMSVEGGSLFDDLIDLHIGFLALEVGQSADKWDQDYMPVKMAATIYHLAREYGLKAAALYKLSDGAIDPRVSA